MSGRSSNRRSRRGNAGVSLMRWVDRMKHTVGSKGSRPRRAVLYTRAGCHLCDEAKAVLERYRERFDLEIDEVDIDRDAALRAKYDRCVPVVVIDGKERFRGRVNESLLLRLFRQSPGPEPETRA